MMLGMRTDAWPVAAGFILFGALPVLSRLTDTPMRWGGKGGGETWPMSLAGALLFSGTMILWGIGAMIADKAIRLGVVGVGLGFFVAAILVAIRDVRRSKSEGTSEKHHLPGPLG